MGFSRSQNVNKEIISDKCVFTPQTLIWGVFYKNCCRIIKVVKAAINKAKICKKPIAGYDKEKNRLMQNMQMGNESMCNKNSKT